MAAVTRIFVDITPGCRKHVSVPSQAAKIALFRALHVPRQPLLMPNPWDAGSAKLLAALGFGALATTSGGYAGTLGRVDGSVSRDEALTHAAAVVDAVDVPVSADLENGFGDSPEAVRATVRAAADTGLAGCSIEDFTGDSGAPIYDLGAATERVAAAVEAASSTEHGMVLTARAENYLHGNPDLDDTIARLVAYQRAGADVLYAPGLGGLDDVRRVTEAVEKPVNVLLRPNLPDVAELTEAGVARISVGSAFHQVTLAALGSAARELLDGGGETYLERAAEGRAQAARAFGAR